MSSAWFVLGLSTAWTLMGLGALLLGTRRRRPVAGPPGSVSALSAEALPGVSVLKPLAGADEELLANLESFFLQDHPRFELLFGVEADTDPSIAVVERLLARHPSVRARVIIHSGLRAQNPKISNLSGIIGEAAYDLVLVSDSNIRAPLDYVRSMAALATSVGPRFGLATNLFAGSGERSLGAALEAAQLNGFVAAGVAASFRVGDPGVVGKSMLFRRSVLEELGGLVSLADVMAEDYVLGKMFHHAGYQVVLSPLVLENISSRMGVPAFVERQLRWSMLRLRLNPWAFVLEPLTSPLAMVPLAYALRGASAPAGVYWGIWALAMILIRDVGGWLRLRGVSRIYVPLLVAPLRELLALSIWVVTPFVKNLAWRGHRVRLGTGTRAFKAGEADLVDPRQSMIGVMDGQRTNPGQRT